MCLCVLCRKINKENKYRNLFSAIKTWLQDLIPKFMCLTRTHIHTHTLEKKFY